MPNSSVAVFATACLPYTFESGMSAVTRVVRWSPKFFPTEGEWLEALGEGTLERPALPESASEQATPADEKLVRELLGRYWSKAGPDRRLAAVRSNGRASAEEIDKAAREKARAMASTPVLIEEPKPSGPRHPGASECSGHPVRISNGHQLCTHCSQDVCPDDLGKGCRT